MDSDGLKGLTSVEVQEMIKRYGLNVIPEKKEGFLKLFLRKFIGFTPFAIEVSAVISFILGRYIDFTVIIALLLVNAVIGLIHESRANEAVELLKQKLKISVYVLRDGSWGKVPAEYLVPNDIIKLRLGDIVPADAVIVDGFLLVDESALTGESLPVEKKAGDPIYAGSPVVRGEAVARITATGIRTRYGRVVELVEVSKPRMIIEEITNSITKWLMAVDMFFIVVVALYLVIKGLNLYELLPFSLTLFLASIPIALPAMTTITLALGSVELARAGVIIKKLESVEAAAMMDTICLDKTGTITENKLVVGEVIPVREGYNIKDIILYAALASEEISEDPIDKAILAKAGELGFKRQGYRVIEFKPFSPETKRSEALVNLDGKTIRAVKGAPQVLLDLDKEVERERFENVVKELGLKGMRPLAVGIEEDGVFRLVGVLGIFDKPREDSARFISEIEGLGVKPVMITGDNLYVASAIAKAVGIKGEIISLRNTTRDILKERIESIGVIAEAYPEDKHDIVVALQSRGHVVGMTGDGVNDSPALRKADLGVAVYNATDIAKSSASIVLTQPGLRNIVDVIKLGRVIYRRIVVWSINKIVKTFQIVYFVALATLLLGIPILSPTHIILMLFMYDFVTLSISTDRLRPSASPERWNIRKLVKVSTFLGLVKVAELFLALYLALDVLKLNMHETQSFIFYILLISGLFNIVNFRELGFFWNSAPSKPMLAAIVCDILAATILIYKGIIITPISPGAIIIALLYAITITLVLTDIAKIIIYKLEGLDKTRLI